jgi:hypothetical protein
MVHVNATAFFWLTRGSPNASHGSPDASHGPPDASREFSRVERCPGMRSMPCSPRRYTRGACRYCPSGSSSGGGGNGACSTGEMHLMAAMLPGHTSLQRKTDRQMRMQKFVAWRREGSAEPGRHAYFTVVASCELAADQPAVPPSSSSAAALGGTLSLEGMPELEFGVDALPDAPPDAPPGAEENVVCGRFLFFDSKLRRAWVEHYLDLLKFHRVVVFCAGLGGDWSGMEDLRASGRLVVVDLQDEMQRVYGARLVDAALYSVGMAQAVAKVLCLLRAHHLGARWTLHVDMDELLLPGRDSALSHRNFTWQDVERALASQFPARGPEEEQEQQPGELSALTLVPVSIAETRPICACNSTRSWQQHLADETRAHLSKDWARTAPFEPFDCANFRKLPTDSCKSTASSSKLALRVDGAHYLNPAAVGNHYVFHCSKLSPLGQCFDRPPVLDVPGRELYLRHLSCLNLPCDAAVVKQVPFWGDARLGPVLARAHIFPRIGRLRSSSRYLDKWRQLVGSNVTLAFEDARVARLVHELANKAKQTIEAHAAQQQPSALAAAEPSEQNLDDK